MYLFSVLSREPAHRKIVGGEREHDHNHPCRKSKPKIFSLANLFENLSPASFFDRKKSEMKKGVDTCGDAERPTPAREQDNPNGFFLIKKAATQIHKLRTKRLHRPSPHVLGQSVGRIGRNLPKKSRYAFLKAGRDRSAQSKRREGQNFPNSDLGVAES